MKNSFGKLHRNEIVSDLAISEKNRKLINKFVEHLKGYVTDVRIAKYRYSLIRFADLVEKDFDKLAEEEIRKAGGIINNSNLSIKTKQDIISEIKTAFKFWFGENQYMPKVVLGLKRAVSKGSLVLPNEMPDEQTIYRMIKACGNSRDQFYIALIGLDGALRPVECRRMKWGDIKKDVHGYYIIVKTAKKSGDKDTRVIRIIKSEPYFIRWSNEYPAEKLDGSFVFVNYSNLEPMNEGTVAALFRRLNKKLKIKGRLYPYLMRHSILTRMSKDPRIPIPLLKKFAGHSLRSNTIAEYQHFWDDDLKDMQLQINGIVKKEEGKEVERKPIRCPKCGKSNEYDAEFCNFCNMALSQKRMVESHEKLLEIDKKLKETESRKNAMNKMLFLIAQREMASMRGKQKKEMEETLNIIAEGMKVENN